MSNSCSYSIHIEFKIYSLIGWLGQGFRWVAVLEKTLQDKSSDRRPRFEASKTCCVRITWLEFKILAVSNHTKVSTICLIPWVWACQNKIELVVHLNHFSSKRLSPLNAIHSQPGRGDTNKRQLHGPPNQSCDNLVHTRGQQMVRTKHFERGPSAEFTCSINNSTKVILKLSKKWYLPNQEALKSN